MELLQEKKGKRSNAMLSNERVSAVQDKNIPHIYKLSVFKTATNYLLFLIISKESKKGTD